MEVIMIVEIGGDYGRVNPCLCCQICRYVGTYPVDKKAIIPAFCDSRTAIVLNLDPQTQNGSHWVAMYLENGKGEYFCSYGSSPTIAQFINFLNRNCKK
jgi:hypothetical protein